MFRLIRCKYKVVLTEPGFPQGAAQVFLLPTEVCQSAAELFGRRKPSRPQIEFASVIALVSISSLANFSPITFL